MKKELTKIRKMVENINLYSYEIKREHAKKIKALHYIDELLEIKEEQYYVVEAPGTYNNLFLIKALSKKEAIDRVYKARFEWRINEDKEKGYSPIYKKDLSCSTLKELDYNSDGIMDLA